MVSVCLMFHSDIIPQPSYIKHHPMTHASVFSGIGGPEVAATMLGWENLFHCEINPFGRKVLDYWYPKSKSSWTSQAAKPSDEDITTTDFTEWRGRLSVPDKREAA